MENKQMYVITMATGSYDSYSVGVVAITDDFNKGEAYVNKMNQTFQSMEKKLPEMYKLERDWQVSNPRPNIIAKGLIEIPKWKGDQKITQEMRNQRNELVLKNQEIARKAQEPMQEWYKKFTQFREDWIKANLTEDEQEIFKNNDENHWYIEEVNWL